MLARSTLDAGVLSLLDFMRASDSTHKSMDLAKNRRGEGGGGGGGANVAYCQQQDSQCWRGGETRLVLVGPMSSESRNRIRRRIGNYHIPRQRRPSTMAAAPIARLQAQVPAISISNLDLEQDHHHHHHHCRHSGDNRHPAHLRQTRPTPTHLHKSDRIGHWWPSSDPMTLSRNVALLLAVVIYLLVGFSPTATEAVDCFKCSSRNGSNPACEDPFHNLNTTRVNSPILPDPQPSVIYHTPCYAGKKGRDGLFPASACIKLTGVFDTTGETLVVRHCALDSGTLTQDTELARMSHCGKFQFEGDLLRGCVLACPEDACNSARGSLLVDLKDGDDMICRRHNSICASRFVSRGTRALAKTSPSRRTTTVLYGPVAYAG